MIRCDCLILQTSVTSDIIYSELSLRLGQEKEIHIFWFLYSLISSLKNPKNSEHDDCFRTFITKPADQLYTLTCYKPANLLNIEFLRLLLNLSIHKNILYLQRRHSSVVSSILCLGNVTNTLVRSCLCLLNPPPSCD